MRSALLILVALAVVVSCNNDRPSQNVQQEKSNDSSSNTALKNQTINKTDSATRTDVNALEQAFNENPSQENAFELAYAYAQAKNNKALWFTDTLIKYGKPEDIGFAWYAKGVYYQNTGDVQTALRFYDSSITTDYTFLDSYRDKGQLQFSLKRYDAALKTFAQGQNLSHDLSAKAEFIYWVAKCFEALGDKRNARDNYERAYAMDKSLREAKEAAEKISL